LKQSDVVLGVLTFAVSEACRREFDYSQQAGKKLMILADPSQGALQQSFPGAVILLEPTDPSQAEQKIVEYLRRSELQEDAQALLALGTIALGLLIFAPQE
jgi:hypothetical protein